MASISYPVYSQQLESFVGETFGEKNQHLDDYDDFLLSQLDKSLNKVQQQSKSNRLNFYDDQWRFDHSRLPYKNRNPKQTSKINSNILKLYQPYPLEHIGGKFYLGPPVIHLKDSELETKLGMKQLFEIANNDDVDDLFSYSHFSSRREKKNAKRIRF